MSMTEIIFSLVDQVSSQMGDMASNAESSMTQIESSADTASTTVDEVGTAADSAGSALDSVDATSIDEAGNAASSAANDLDEAASSAEEAGQAADSISSQAINEAASAASGLATDFDEVATSAEDAANKAEDVGTSTSNAGQTSALGAGMATAAVATLTAGLEMTAQTASQTNATFQKMSSTQFPESEIRGMISSLTSATFKTEDALLYVKTLKQIGVTGKASLSAGATAFNQIATATGVSSDRVVTFSNSMVAMGIDMQNVPSTFNAIAYANANMVGGFDTYVNWMAKYDSTFKSMGLTIDQTAVLISGATKKFGGGRAAYSGLQTAINESGGDLGKLASALDLSSDSLTNASQITGQYSGKIEKNAGITAQNTTFVQKAQAEVEKLKTQYSGIYGPLASFGGAISGLITVMGSVITMKAAMATATNTAILAQNGETVATNASTLSKVRARATDLASAAATAIRTTAMEIQTGMTASSIAVIAAQTGATNVNTAATNAGALTYARAAVTLVAQKAASIASTVATQGMAAAQWLLNAAMNANPIAIVVLAIVALVAILAVLYNKNETVRNAINALWGGLQALGSYIMGGLMAAWNGLKTALSPITEALGNLWAAISKVWSSFAGGQAAKAGSTFNTIGNYAKALWAIIQQLAIAVGSALMPVFQTLYGVLVQVAGFVGGFFSAVWTTISGILSAVIGFIAGFINVLTGLVSGTMTMSQAMGAIWELLKGMIMRILGSIMMGIGLWATLLIQKGENAAIGFVTGIITWLASLPGRVWTYLMYTLQRIQNFANSAREMASSAAGQMVSAFSSYLSSLPGKMYTWGKNAINSFINAIINSIPGLRSALNMVSSLFPHSPPKEGPLATVKAENLYRWGASLGNALTGGVNDSTDGLFGDLGTVGSVKGAVSGSNGGNVTIQIDVKDGAVKIMGNADKGTVENAGTILGNSIADNLVKGARTNGLNLNL